MTAILGLNAYHGDAAAALVVDGELVAAAEEERFNRVKHVAGFPRSPPPGAWRDAGLTPGELDHVAIGRDPRANLGAKIVQTPRRRRTRLRRGRLANAARSAACATISPRRSGSHPDSCAPSSTTSSTTRRTSRARSSSRRSRNAAILTVDGFGDFASAMLAVGRGNRARGARPRPLPALARHLLHGGHAVARLPEVRRRGQGDGPRAVRRPRGPPRQDARARAASTGSSS